jgi:tetratricopeptide (TPR) repeat protein
MSDGRATVDPEDLQAEREFLLRSLDDLDDELLAGNIDPDTYRELHDDYTARAAAVIRSIDDGVARLGPDAPRLSAAMRVVTIGGIVVFCVLAALLLANTIGQRAPGQTPTGNDNVGAATTIDTGRALKAAAAANPRSYDARIAYARYLIGSDPAGALAEYTAAASIDPSQPEPFAYRGWIAVLAAQQLQDAGQRSLLLQRATSDLNQAISIDPSYADAYVFKGVMLFRLEDKPADAVTVLQRFLLLAPQDHPMRALVTQTLAQAEAAANAKTP